MILLLKMLISLNFMGYAQQKHYEEEFIACPRGITI